MNIPLPGSWEQKAMLLVLLLLRSLFLENEWYGHNEDHPENVTLKFDSSLEIHSS